MAKATKTWKLGELARGGVITVETTAKKVTIIAKDWDFSKGSNKSSDQSKAKEFDRETYNATDNNVERQMMDFLEDLTTHYYASEVVKWIKTKVELQSRFDW